MEGLTMPRPTTLESLRAADEHLTRALNCLRDARENELADACAAGNLPGASGADAHARHLICNRALIAAERLATAAREILS